MPNQRKSWTKEEDDIMKHYYPTMGPAVIKFLPNRTKQMIGHRASRLKVHMLNRYQNNIGNGNFKKCEDPWGNKFESITAMLKHYGVSRSKYSSAIARGKSLKEILLSKTITKTFWTEKEKAILKERYPEVGPNIPELNRSIGQITSQARRLGLYCSYRKCLKTEDKMGKVFRTDCGLSFTVISAEKEHVKSKRDKKTKRDKETLTIEWEDGEKMSGLTWTRITHHKGNLGHPFLKRGQKSTYKNFSTIKGRKGDDGNVWYKCTCQICGKSYVETPQFMIAHHKVHTEQGEKP